MTGVTSPDNIPYLETSDGVYSSAFSESQAEAIQDALTERTAAIEMMGLDLIESREFTGVTEAAFDGVFDDSKYWNYRILVDYTRPGSAGSSSQLRVGGVNQAGANTYRNQYIGAQNNSVTALASQNTEFSHWGPTDAAREWFDMTLFSPNHASSPTRVINNLGLHVNASGIMYVRTATALHAPSIAADGFRVYVSTGNMTSGRALIYGMRK